MSTDNKEFKKIEITPEQFKKFRIEFVNILL
jgi:hypothetical protein